MSEIDAVAIIFLFDTHSPWYDMIWVNGHYSGIQRFEENKKFDIFDVYYAICRSYKFSSGHRWEIYFHFEVKTRLKVRKTKSLFLARDV